MKKIVLSAVAVVAMSSFAVAGGDIAPVEEPVVVPEPVVTDAGFYLGLAYGWQNISADAVDYFPASTVVNGIWWQNNDASDLSLADYDASSIMLQAGYKFNSYIAVEGRYWFGLEEGVTNGDLAIDSWGIYVKPMYPVTDAFDIYALLGYARSDATLSNVYGEWDLNEQDNIDGFSWGIGAAYSFTDNLAVFVDYVSLYDETFGNDIDGEVDASIDTVNFGLTYQF